MKETFGDIWRIQFRFDAVCITTNGYVKKNGEAVMGRGIAKEASLKYPDFPKRLGYILREFGNVVWPFEFDRWNGEADYQELLFSFPVKPIFGPNGEMGWKARADLELIKDSAKQLVSYVDEMHLKGVLLPRPGCGNGGLKWEQVKPVIEPILDDRFMVVTWHP